MTDHYIVCGMGNVGYRIVRLLWRLGLPVTVITLGQREEWKRIGEEEGIDLIQGDARDERLLAQAGLQHARALIIATDQDLINIEIAFDARQQRADLPIVMRLFDQNLARQMESGFELRRVLATSALSAPSFAVAALSEEALCAFQQNGVLYLIRSLMVREGDALDGKTARQIADWQFVTLMLERVDESPRIAPDPETRFAPGDHVTLIGRKEDWDRRFPSCRRAAHTPSPLQRTGRFLRQHLAPRHMIEFVQKMWRSTSLPLRAVFLALITLIILNVFIFQYAMNLRFVDALYFILSMVTVASYGDISLANVSAPLKLYTCLVMLLGSATIAVLYTIITDFVITARFRQIGGRQRIPEEGHIVVVGLGNVGYRIVEELVRAQEEVVAVQLNPDGQFVRSVRDMQRTQVIIGDARLPDTLKTANVEKARAVIAATSDDAVNLSVGFTARQMNAQAQIVLRLFSPDFARKVRATTQIQAYSPASLAAPAFVASALHEGVRAAFVMNDRLFILLQRAVGEEWHGLTPDQLRQREEAVILLHRREAGGEFQCPAGSATLHSSDQVQALVWRRLRPEE